jgi:hypothetical protein
LRSFASSSRFRPSSSCSIQRNYAHLAIYINSWQAAPDVQAHWIMPTALLARADEVIE